MAQRTITATLGDDGYWSVAEGDRSSDYLCWDEMLGHFASMTMPPGGKIYPMRTDEEHKIHRQHYVQAEESECDDWSSNETHIPF